MTAALVRVLAAFGVLALVLVASLAAPEIAVAPTGAQFLSIPRFLIGSGEFLQLTNSQPAAGAEHSMVVPSGQCWRLMGVQVSLITNVTAANREVTLRVDNGSSSTLMSPSRQNQIASLTRTYMWAPGQATTTPVTQPSFTAPLPDAFYVCSGAGIGTWNIQTLTSNIQAGDQFSNLMVWLERWRF